VVEQWQRRSRRRANNPPPWQLWLQLVLQAGGQCVTTEQVVLQPWQRLNNGVRAWWQLLAQLTAYAEHAL